MKRKICTIFVAICLLVSSLIALVACDDPNQGPAKLVMSQLSYDEATKTISWNKVQNAVGYELKIGTNGTYSSEGIIEDGSKMKYVSTETANEYKVFVIAKGDGTSFSDSDEKVLEVSVSSTSKETVTLEMSELSYDSDTQVVSWDKVANASGYALKVDGNAKSSDSINAVGNKMQYALNEATSGEYTVSVKALGSETDTHIYTDSDEESIEVEFAKEAYELSAPQNLRIVNHELVWDAVSENNGYEVQVNDETLVSLSKSTTKYAVWKLFVPGTYSIKILAKGDGENTLDSEASEFEYTVEAERVSAGDNHIISIDAEGNIWAWGKNDKGQVGDDTTADKLQPVQVTTGTVFVSVSAAVNRSMALDEEGSLWVWGQNTDGYLFFDQKGSNILCPTKHQFNTTIKFAVISAGANHTLALTKDGELYGWGSNQYGQLGYSSFTDAINNPSKLSGVSSMRFISISAGATHSLAVANDGSVYATGSNLHGKIGNGEAGTNLSDKVAYGFTEVISSGIYSVSAGDSHSLALDLEGNLWAWGRNYYSQLGDGTTVDKATPTKIATTMKFASVRASGTFSIGVGMDGKLYGWGNNNLGMIANVQSTKAPAVISELDIAYVGVALNNTIIVTTDGKLLVTGFNYGGQLGIGKPSSETNYRSSFAEVECTAVFYQNTTTDD